MNFNSINPTTEKVVASYRMLSVEDEQDIVNRADEAQKIWANVALANRIAVMRRIADVLRRDVEDIATLITTEMGKPIVQAHSEVMKCASVCEYMADIAPAILARQLVELEDGPAEILSEPYGLVLCIMPWNFPLWQFFRFAAPALLVGNGILLKHASTTWGCALRAAAVCLEAGLPEHVVSCLMIGIPRVSFVLADPRVRAITLTGSVQAGSSVASQTGTQLKKTVLELGGNDAYIVCNDADMNVTVEACVASRIINSGQSCIAAKRFIVHQSVHDEFVARVAERFDSLVVADPMDPRTEVGPLASSKAREVLLDQVLQCLDKGGRIATKRLFDEVPQRGFFLCPTLMTDLYLDTPAFRDELFGPVAGVFSYQTDDEAVELANNSEYGLGGAVFSQNHGRAREIAREMECGMVAINDYVRSHPRLPFGGVKSSGYGRELGEAGLREFAMLKVVR